MSNELNPIVAAALGFNDGANKGFWRQQVRDSKGRWAEMGAEIRAMLKLGDGTVDSKIGISVGSTGDGRLRVMFKDVDGVPDGIYPINSNNAEIVSAQLSPDYLRSQGIDPNKDIHGNPVGELVPQDLAEISKERADIQEGDIRLATEGMNTPEGQEQANYKNTPEGQAEAAKPGAGAKKSIFDFEKEDFIKEDVSRIRKYDGSGRFSEEPYTLLPLGVSDPHDRAVSNAWNDAMSGGFPDLDSMILAAKDSGDDGDKPKTKSLFDLNPGDRILDKDNNALTYVSDKDAGDGKNRIVIFTKEDGSTVRAIVPSKQRFNVAPKQKPAPKPKLMDNKLLDKLESTAEKARKAGDLDPQLESDLIDLTSRIDNIEDVTAAEANEMIGRLSKHIEDKSVVKTPSEKPPTPTPTPTPPPEIVRKDRPDNGQEIALPDTPESELWGKKVAPLRDENGKRVHAIDPETGEVKSTFVEDPDAILNDLLEEYPNAVWTPDGGLLVERSKFKDPDGTERQLEAIIRRTSGANYMVGYRITEPDGTSVEYFSHDYRDSFSSIHGKTNGIQRMSAILKGNLPDDFLPTMRKTGNREWKTYFGTGKFEDRLKYFRGRHTSRATEESLLRDLARAKATGKDSEIKKAEYNLDLLRKDFKGDIELYRANATIQNMKLVTLDETIDKYANGRFYLVNNAEGKSNGTVLRSGVEGIYGSIDQGDVEGIAEVWKALRGRLPDMIQNPDVAQLTLDRIRKGYADRHPGENKRTLSAFTTSGYNLVTDEGYDEGAFEEAPHVGGRGRIIEKNMLVEYTNNNNQKSVGIVHSVVPVDKNSASPNEFFDYVKVSFRGQDGTMQSPVIVSAKNLEVLDESGISDEALKRVTVYTPNLKGEEMRRARFGDAYVLYEKSRYFDMLPGGTTNVGDGYNPVVKDPIHYNTDTLTPGDYLYDKDGLPIGQIAGIRPTTSDSGEAGYTFAHVDPNGNIGFTSVKANETRAPKEGLSRSDSRGSSESDPGFTPNPNDFADAGFDAESIGNAATNAQDLFTQLVDAQGYFDYNHLGTGLRNLMSVNAARAAYQADASEENRAAYKKALTEYYTHMAKYKHAGAKLHNVDYTPPSVGSDDILDGKDIAEINAKIHATHAPFASDPEKKQTSKATYQDVVDHLSNPDNVYSGDVPTGWEAIPAENLVAKYLEDSRKVGEVLASMVESTGDGSAKLELSDDLLNALAKVHFININTNRNGKLNPIKYHTITSPDGDSIDVAIDRDGSGYIASKTLINDTASVISGYRSRLNMSKPVNYKLISRDEASDKSSSVLGYAFLGSMNAHTIVENLERSIARGISEEDWFAVAMGENPDMLMQYVAAHEIGHLIEGLVWPDGAVYDSSKIEEDYKNIKSNKISRYGSSNNHEHFAESMARWYLTGQADPRFIQLLINSGVLDSGNSKQS